MAAGDLTAGRLRGRRAFLTGAASGIGLATARRLAAEGARVVMTDARPEALYEASGRVDGALDAVICNVADEASVQAAIERAVDAMDGLDILVCCAGIVRAESTRAMSLAQWEDVIRVNLTGTFLPIKHALPHLAAAGGGSIVTVGSVASVVAAGRSSAYDASKGGVLQLTRAVAVEHVEDGIRANCVLPGVVRTGLADSSRQLHGSIETDNARAPAQRLQIPMARSAAPGEIAAVIAFLASDDASFITGAAIAADGGYTAI